MEKILARRILNAMEERDVRNTEPNIIHRGLASAIHNSRLHGVTIRYCIRAFSGAKTIVRTIFYFNGDHRLSEFR